MEASAPISLYLDLEEGEAANIEVVARAALAWSSALKELAFVIDPSAEIEIELISGTEGSLGLNACIKAFSKIANQHPKLATVVLTSITWFSLQTLAYSYEKVLDWLTGSSAPPIVKNMSKAEIENLAREVVKAQQAEIAQEPRKQIFRELSGDRSIKGVGATQIPNHRPAAIIPRSDFPRQAGEPMVVQQPEVKKRAVTERMVVTLVSPTLKDAERRWRFQSGTMPEFGATMKDHEFLSAVATGRVGLPLRTGIEMEIDLETKQEMNDDLWTVKERNVLKVHRPGTLPDPTLLPLSPPNQR